MPDFISEFINGDTIPLIGAVLLVVVSLTSVLSYVILSFITTSMGAQLRRPASTFHRDISTILEKNQNKIGLRKYGWKAGAARRRVLLATGNPSAYSMVPFTDMNSGKLTPNEILTISTIDLQEKDNFMKNLNAPLPLIQDKTKKLIWGFFHPFCNAGGGGERVLWEAIVSTLANNKRHICVIYTGDSAPATQILDNVKNHFGIDLIGESRVVFIYLTKRSWVEGRNWKHFTLIGQAFGSVLLGYEAIRTLPPDVFVDTMGFPFSYPVVSSILNIPIAAYVHFPVISKDMLDKISVTSLSSALKKLYWLIFTLAYAWVGSYVSVVLANGSWTCNHIRKLWWWNHKKEHVQILYPPVETNKLLALAAKSQDQGVKRNNSIVCVAQFRPEKRHSLIIREYSIFIKNYIKTHPDSSNAEIPRLILVGSTTNSINISDLKELAKSLGVSDYVEFVLNAPWSEVENYLLTCQFGINAMWNEHFGISVVEYMASGLIPICHASAGPLLDIVVPYPLEDAPTDDNYLSISDDSNRTGFFFISSEDPTTNDDKQIKYKKVNELHEVLVEVYNVSTDQWEKIRERSLKSISKRFTAQEFDWKWNKKIDRLITLESVCKRDRLEMGQIE